MKRIDWTEYRNSVPSRIQVSNKIFFEVCWTDGFKDEKTVGETRFEPNQIVLKTNESEKETIKTYIHEILHAFSDVYEIGLTEKQVQRLEKGLTYALKPGNLFRQGDK